MKPHEILQKIIDEDGSCDWISSDAHDICRNCPLGGRTGCATFVNDIMGSWNDADYLEVAKRLLANLEINRIILGEDIEE